MQSKICFETPANMPKLLELEFQTKLTILNLLLFNYTSAFANTYETHLIRDRCQSK